MYSAWQAYSRRKRMPAIVREWMALDSSMTQRLRERCSSPLSVHLLWTGAGRLKKDEAGLLRAARHHAYVREVLLCAGEQTVLAARTVCVSRNLRTWIAKLGEQPLGERLFSSEKPRCAVREFTRLTPRYQIHALVRLMPGLRLRPCWARRRLYLLGSGGLLVTEIFLPALFSYCSTSNRLHVTNRGLKAERDQALRNI